MTRQTIEAKFRETRQRYGADGSTLAMQDYVFDVGGKQTIVAVELEAIATLEGQLSPSEVEIAVRTFIEMQTDQQRMGRIALDRPTMLLVAERLDWLRRFRQTS
jgi:hypothetical protein